uniref:Transmembrane protein n=1 Tax=Medicago truncatula TaxID=3880 RepID=A2Q565_MEDTR|nr:hypothetical protein MtrDRAFT_AC160012g23v2 [Medicago truncatula]
MNGCRHFALTVRTLDIILQVVDGCTRTKEIQQEKLPITSVHVLEEVTETREEPFEVANAATTQSLFQDVMELEWSAHNQGIPTAETNYVTAESDETNVDTNDVTVEKAVNDMEISASAMPLGNQNDILEAQIIQSLRCSTKRHTPAKTFSAVWIYGLEFVSMTNELLRRDLRKVWRHRMEVSRSANLVGMSVFPPDAYPYSLLSKQKFVV